MKESIGIRPCAFVYLLLAALMFLTWFVGVTGLSGLTIALPVLGLSLVKGFLIGDYYMGLKLVPGGWRWVITIWLLLPGSLIAIAFSIGSSI